MLKNPAPVDRRDLVLELVNPGIRRRKGVIKSRKFVKSREFLEEVSLKLKEDKV